MLSTVAPPRHGSSDRVAHAGVMTRRPLPPGLGPIFHVADARAAGVSPGRLRGADLGRPFRGIRTTGARQEGDDPYGAIEAEHRHRMAAFAPLMHERDFFSHVSAAVLHGIPLPLWALVDAPVHVGVMAPGRLRRAAGIRGHQTTPALSRIITDPASGMRTTDAATTWASLARLLLRLEDVVAAGDAVIREWRAEPLASLAELEAAVGAGRRVGIERLRAALPLLRPRSASRQESCLRLALVFAGLPEPALNHPVHDARGYIGSVDLAYPPQRVAIEYEGEHHLRSQEQWAADIQRYARLRAAGWVVVQVTARMLSRDPSAVVRDVRAALRAAS